MHSIPPSGDGASLQGNSSLQWMMVMDAMGHGPIAHAITQQTLGYFNKSLQGSFLSWSSTDLLTHLHDHLRVVGPSAQAAIGLFRFDLRGGMLETVMVGNLEAVLIHPQGRSRVHSQHGMVGGIYPQTLHPQTFSLAGNQVLAVFSDGISTTKMVDQLPKQIFGPLANRSTQEHARLIVEHYGKDHDDASCALVRIDEVLHD
jgi:hypothetical protein